VLSLHCCSRCLLAILSRNCTPPLPPLPPPHLSPPRHVAAASRLVVALHPVCYSYKDCEDRCSQAANLTDDTRVRLSDLIDAYAESVVMGQVKAAGFLHLCVIVTICTAARC
jgi:hypothetical protein